MKSFDEHTNEPKQLDEVSFLRSASTAVLMNHINTKRKQITKSKKVDARTDVASS